VLDRHTAVAAELVGQVVVADVVGVAVGGEDDQPGPRAHPVNGIAQGLPECGGGAGVHQEQGVAGPVHQGVGDVGLVVGDVELLTQHQHGAVVELQDVSEGRRGGHVFSFAGCRNRLFGLTTPIRPHPGWRDCRLGRRHMISGSRLAPVTSR